MPVQRNTKKRRSAAAMLRVQIHVRLPKLKAGASYAPEFLDEVVKAWWDDGETGYRRIKVIAISWTRGGRRAGRENTPSRIHAARERFQNIRTSLEFRARV